MRILESLLQNQNSVENLNFTSPHESETINSTQENLQMKLTEDRLNAILGLDSRTGTNMEVILPPNHSSEFPVGTFTANCGLSSRTGAWTDD